MMPKDTHARMAALEGFRGLAALIVFFSHFAVMVYPAFYWENVASHCRNIDWLIGQTPLSFLLNGNSGVVFFLMITGFGIDNLMTRESTATIRKFFVLRYFKLLTLVLLASGEIILLYKINALFYNDAATLAQTPWFHGYDPGKIDFYIALKNNPLQSFSSYNGVLWPMKYFFLGSGIAYILHSLAAETAHPHIIFALSLLICVNMNEPYYMCVIAGVMISKWYHATKEMRLRPWTDWMIPIWGIYFAAYPSGHAPDTLWYNWLPHGEYLMVVYHTIGIGLLFFSALYGTIWKQLLECKLLQFFGRYAAEIYIAHYGVLISLSAYLICSLTKTYGYNRSALLSFCVSFIVVIAFSIIINYALKFCYRGLEKIYAKVFAPST